MENFFKKVGDFIKAGWEKFKGLPIVKPLWLMVYSRKAVIASAAAGWLLTIFPDLLPAKDEVLVVITQVIGILFLAIGTSIGIAIEDASKNTNRVGVTVNGAGGAGGSEKADPQS